MLGLTPSAQTLPFSTSALKDPCPACSSSATLASPAPVLLESSSCSLSPTIPRVTPALPGKFLLHQGSLLPPLTLSLCSKADKRQINAGARPVDSQLPTTQMSPAPTALPFPRTGQLSPCSSPSWKPAAPEERHPLKLWKLPEQALGQVQDQQKFWGEERAQEDGRASPPVRATAPGAGRRSSAHGTSCVTPGPAAGAQRARTGSSPEHHPQQGTGRAMLPCASPDSDNHCARKKKKKNNYFPNHTSLPEQRKSQRAGVKPS